MSNAFAQTAPTDVAFVGVEAILGGDYFVSLRLWWWDHVIETRAIGPIPRRNPMLGLVRMDIFSSNTG